MPDKDTDITIGKDSTYTDGSTTGSKFNGVIGNDEELTRVKSLKIDTEDGKVTGIAMPVWNWGRYYELIVRSLLHGTWDETSDDNQVRAVNYWYGMSSGVIDIRYAPGLPYQTRKLVQLLRNGIVEGSINPFGGELHSQNGVVQIEGFPPLPSTQIVEMNWLADNVVGTIPQLDDEPKVPAL